MGVVRSSLRAACPCRCDGLYISIRFQRRLILFRHDRSHWPDVRRRRRPTAPYIWGATATEVFGPTAAGNPVYLGITGPTDFGDGAATEASSSTGDTFGYGGLDQDLLLPNGYVSGSFISGTDTWDDTTLAALGLTPGTYNYTWGSGVDGSFTSNVGIAPVPEPSSLGLMSLVVLAIAFPLLRHRRGIST